MFGNQTIQADVEFRTNLGQFRADMSGIRGEYARTTGAMSTESLRAAVAQEKLDRVLAKNTADSYAAKRATLAYRNEMASLNGQATRTAGGLAREERELGGLSRGALAGSGALGRFGRAAVFASTSVLGGYGLIFAVKSLIKAADDEAVALARVDGALETSGISRREYKQRIDEALAAEVRLTGFEKTDLANALAANIIRFGDVNKALHANAIAADVARQKGVDLATAQQMIQRASFGNPRAAKQLGIELEKTTTNMDKLKASTKNASAEQIANAKAADLQANETATLDAAARKYHGDAARFLQTTAGKQAELNSQLTDSKAIIGQELLPLISKYSVELAAWLEKMNSSGKLQRDVNAAVHDATTLFHLFGASARFADEILKGLDKTLGGNKNTIEALTAALIAYKLRGLVPVAGEIGAVGSKATLAGGKVGALTSRLGALSRFGTLTIGIDLLVHASGTKGALGIAEHIFGGGLVGAALAGPEGAVIGGTAEGIKGALDAASAADGGKRGFKQQLMAAQQAALKARYPSLAAGETTQGLADALGRLTAAGRGSSPEYGELERLYNQLLKRGPEATVSAAAAQRFNKRYALPSLTTGITGGAGQHGALATNDHHSSGAAGTHGRGGKPKPLVLGLDYRQQNALLVAEATKGTGDDRRVLNKQLSFLNSALGQKGLNEQQRNQLLTARGSVLSQIDSITSANAGTAKRRDTEEQRARRKRITQLTQVPAGLRIEEANARAHGASEEAIVAILEKEKKALEKQITLLRKIGATKDKIAKATENEAHVQARINATKKKKPNTKAEFGKLQTEFLDSLSQDLGDYAPNVLGGTGPGASSVTVNQHFPHPPTDDGRREAIYAFHAMSAAFDG